MIKEPKSPNQSIQINEESVLEESKTDSSFSFLQSPFWATFKSRHGWKPYRFNIKKEKDFELSVLVRTFAKAFSVAYVPLAPIFFTESKQAYFEFLSLVAKELKKHLPKNTLYIRFDPPVCFEQDFSKKDLLNFLKKNKIKKPTSDIQPPDTVLLDLTQSTDQILENMKSKWRYNIRLAEKKDVEVEKCGVEKIDTFYDLYKTTSQRDGIALHSKSYYQDLFDCASQKAAESEQATSEKTPTESVQTPMAPKITLYIAKHEGTPLASIITLFWKKEAVYLYGASSNEKRNLMPAYLLQWNAIQDAKNSGCTVYDFYGIPPTDDENHPMHGLYRFKTGFGGKIVHRIGSVDVPLNFLYFPYTIAENLRLFWYKKVKKFLKKK